MIVMTILLSFLTIALAMTLLAINSGRGRNGGMGCHTLSECGTEAELCGWCHGRCREK